MTDDAPLEADGWLLDGETAARRTVRIRLEGDTLAIDELGGGLAERWPVAELRRANRGDRARPLRITRSDNNSPERHDGLRPDEMRLTVREDGPNAADGAALAATIERRAPLDRRRRRDRRLGRRLIYTALGAVAAISFVLFVLIPLAADRIASLIPPEREIQFGESLIASILEAEEFVGRECSAAAGQRALAIMVDRLETVAGAHVPLTVRVTSDGRLNAFALPGGQIVLFNGLVSNASSADEVAGVLAHEIGHVIGRHSTQAALRTGASLAIISILLGDASGALVATGVGSALVEARNTRELETEADAAAIEILSAAGVSTAPTASFFDRVIERYGESASLFASHPLSSERAALFRNGPASPGSAPILTDAQFRDLQRICDDVAPGRDGLGPRSGEPPRDADRGSAGRGPSRPGGAKEAGD